MPCFTLRKGDAIVQNIFNFKTEVCFVTEFASHESYPAEVEQNKQPQVESRDVSSQDNSDEDDEVALREQLLKSLAVKRKTKLDVGVTRHCDYFTMTSCNRQIFPLVLTQNCVI